MMVLNWQRGFVRAKSVQQAQKRASDQLVQLTGADSFMTAYILLVFSQTLHSGRNCVYILVFREDREGVRE